MNNLKRTLILILVAFAPAAIAATPTPSAAPPVPASQSAKVVSYGDKDIVSVKAKIRFTTLIVLPKQEQILDFTCGDKEFWIVNGSQNFAYVKPAKAGSQTNLNLITASGNVYSFVLSEVSEAADPEPDLKIFVEPKDESILSAASGQSRFLTAQQVEDYRQQIDIAKAGARDAREEAKKAIEREANNFREQYPASLKFAYRIQHGKRPFNVTAMYTDGKFTYIQAHPQELPALYELKDGKPNLVQFEFRDGTYTVSKILDSGYLAIGKQKLAFIRTDSADK